MRACAALPAFEETAGNSVARFELPDAISHGHHFSGGVGIWYARQWRVPRARRADSIKIAPVDRRRLDPEPDFAWTGIAYIYICQFEGIDAIVVLNSPGFHVDIPFI